jgi:NADP-dependent 3-hydroxy acid dehydrogenase YdfG
MGTGSKAAERALPSSGEPLVGRRVLVTGASDGIGEAICFELAAAGARVGLVARRREPLDATAARVDGIAVAGDVSDLDAVEDVVAEVTEKLGGLDVLVNNAGIMVLGGIEQTDPRRWKTMFEVNVTGMLAMTHAALPHLKTSPCADVVNIASLAGHRLPSAAGGVYAATKQAVRTISEALRLEVAPAGIRVTVVSPGLVRSELARGVEDSEIRAAVERAQSEFGLDARDVAVSIGAILRQPRHMTTHEILIAAIDQATWGVGQ